MCLLLLQRATRLRVPVALLDGGAEWDRASAPSTPVSCSGFSGCHLPVLRVPECSRCSSGVLSWTVPQRVRDLSLHQRSRGC
ncbi:hypothetical protein C0J52_10588 [Blattella germanica]|nr:hypothetical protein C0J52_10588 [Blattella germanica]